MKQTTAVNGAKGFLKQLLWKTNPHLFHRWVGYRGQIFSIGIYLGESPYRLSPQQAANNPVLTATDVTDVPAAFVADPFMCKADGRWYMLFEVLSKITRKGQIGLASSSDALNWTYEGIVLREPFHLAYPYVFKCGKQHFMIPDSPGNGVRLYRAADFPHRWEHVDTLLEGEYFVDSSVLNSGDRWWLFTASSAKRTDIKSLRLFYADDLSGPWSEHPSSPIVKSNDSISRPGGRVLVVDGTPVRFAQDGVPAYGSCVRAFEIHELSTTNYFEQEVEPAPILSAARTQWNSGGMHHVDAHLLDDGSWIACVDGWFLS